MNSSVILSAAKDLLCAATMVAIVTSGVRSQSIASRVAAAPNGVVRMEFAGRTGVCGDGRDVIGYRNALFARNFQSFGRWNGTRCTPGPLRVTLSIDDGQVTRLQTQVGREWFTTAQPVTDLGVVSPQEASAYIFSLVPRIETATGKDRLLIPAVLAEDAEVVQPLLSLARDTDRTLSTRRSAVQWLGLMGDASIVPTLVELVRADADSSADRKSGKKGLGSAALAALGLLEDNAGVPALIDLARSGSPRERRDAIFWLGQNGDERAIRVLHQVIENEGESNELRAHAIFALSHGDDVASAEFAYLRAVYPRLGADKLKESVFQGQQQDKSAEAGRWLIAKALDASEPTRLRRSALFWAGQHGATPTADLVRVYRDADNDNLREHAIFVLSQRSDDASTDELLRIARDDKDRNMRGKALFWLAQKHDPRVTKLLSDLILK